MNQDVSRAVEGYWASPLPHEQLNVLRRRGRVRRYGEHEVLFIEGGPADHVLIVERGMVSITNSSADGRVSMLALCGPGELVGDFACLDQSPRSATVTALTPLVGITIAAPVFRAALLSDARLTFELLRVTVGRIRMADLRLAEIGVHSAQDRILRLLVQLATRIGQHASGSARSGPAHSGAGHSGAGHDVKVPITHQELADSVGASRGSAARLLRELRTLGVVTTRRGVIEVHDLERLAGLIQEGV
jgi:CRP/FNR family transcriptional regulator, cyclic AMP receptor protein